MQFLYQIALKSAYRDPLTGLNNRTAIEKNLFREIDLAKRHRQSLALLVMDPDAVHRLCRARLKKTTIWSITINIVVLQMTAGL